MNRAMKAPHTPAPFGMEAAVIGDTAGDERVRKLEKDSGGPREQEDHFSLKLPSDGLDRRKRCGHVRAPYPRWNHEYLRTPAFAQVDCSAQTNQPHFRSGTPEPANKNETAGSRD